MSVHDAIRQNVLKDNNLSPNSHLPNTTYQTPPMYTCGQLPYSFIVRNVYRLLKGHLQGKKKTNLTKEITKDFTCILYIYLYIDTHIHTLNYMCKLVELERSIYKVDLCAGTQRYGVPALLLTVKK